MTLLNKYCHRERSEAISKFNNSIDCFVVPPRNDDIFILKLYIIKDIIIIIIIIFDTIDIMLNFAN